MKPSKEQLRVLQLLAQDPARHIDMRVGVGVAPIRAGLDGKIYGAVVAQPTIACLLRRQWIGRDGYITESGRVVSS